MTDDTPKRTCKTCQKEYPLTSEYFYRGHKSVGGFIRHCKDCQSKKLGYKRRKITGRLENGTRRCYVCKQVFPATNEHFSPNKGTLDGMQSYCKSCAAQMQREYRTNNKAVVRETDKRRSIRNPNRNKYSNNPAAGRRQAAKRRARKKGAQGTHTAAQELEQKTRQKNRCYYCGSKLTKWHADHIVPLSRGGSDLIDNIAITCPSCNLHKHDKMPHEWPEGGKLL